MAVNNHCVVDSFVRKIDFISPVQVHRGICELKPKAINLTKAIVNLARALDPNYPLVVFASLSDLEVNKICDFLGDHETVLVLSPALQSMFYILKNLSGSVGLVGLSESQPEVVKSDSMMVQSLHANNSSLERVAAQKLLSDLKYHGRTRDASGEFKNLIYEERPGKFSELMLEEHTIRHGIKRLSPIAQGGLSEHPRALLPVESGFALFSAMFTSSHKASPKVDETLGSSEAGSLANSKVSMSATIAMATLQTSGLGVQMELQVLQAAVQTWLFEIGIKPESVERVYLGVPWLALAGYLGESLKHSIFPNAKIMFLDQGFGWHPLATLLQSMASLESVPSLYINFGRNKSYLSLTWS